MRHLFIFLLFLNCFFFADGPLTTWSQSTGGFLGISYLSMLGGAFYHMCLWLALFSFFLWRKNEAAAQKVYTFLSFLALTMSIAYAMKFGVGRLRPSAWIDGLSPLFIPFSYMLHES